MKPLGDAEPAMLAVDGQMAQEHVEAVEDCEEGAQHLPATVGNRNKAKPVPSSNQQSDSAGHIVFIFAETG